MNKQSLFFFELMPCLSLNYMKHFNILSLREIYKTLIAACLALIACTMPYTTNGQNKPGNYETEIKTADDAFNLKDYGSALLYYRSAGILQPSQQYPQDRIDQISRLLNENSNLKNSLFEDAILKGESFLKVKDYPAAKLEFRKAVELDPAAQYPKDKLAAIRQVYTDPGDAARYSDAIAKAEKALSAGDFDMAKNWYQIALTANPYARLPRDKMQETEKLKAESIARKSQYDKIIAGADKLLLAEQRPEARSEYKKALELLPNQAYAMQRLSEIDAWLNDRKKEQDSYDLAISQADQFYINRDFANARIKYQEALNVKPAARYPRDMLEKTSSGESEVKSLRERYDAAIASADNFFKSGDTDAALTGYKSASAIMPGETYPRTRIAEIEKGIGEKASRKEAYDIAILNGNQALEQDKHEAALAHYKNALSLLPGEKYPTEKIDEINKLLADRKQAEDSYRTTIASADLKFKNKQYNEAAIDYRSANALKPGEKYPLDKLNEIDAIIKAQQNKDDSYNIAIAAADDYFGQKNYSGALSSYQEASSLKPTEKYPKDRIAEINRIIQQLKQLDDSYSTALASADRLLLSKKYNDAAAGYRKALDIKPGEKYPQDKIEEINTILAGIKLLDEKYSAAVIKADSLFAGQKLADAIAMYREALVIKPAEKYPQQKIAEAENILAKNKAFDDSYASVLISADQLLTEKKYQEALTGFKKASSMKPAEQYPIDKIADINRILAGLAATQSAYDNAVAEGDRQFQSKKYDEAIASYNQALTLKPGEEYPEGKIAEINTILKGIKATDEAYAKAIADADASLMAQEYQEALTGYRSALKIKPGEKYPQEKITEIDRLVAAIKTTNDAYDKAVSAADLLFDAAKFEESITGYNKALEIKPNEKYPNERIAEAGKMIADLKEKQQSYQKAIAEGDRQFTAKAYADALSAYGNAKTLFPAEKYPDQKIAEINTILAGIKATEDRYNEAIANADAFFNQKKYREALEPYERALTIKPAEAYPVQQIDKINNLLAEQKKIDDDYAKIIAEADKSLADKKYQPALASFRSALELKPAEQYPQDKIKAINTILADLKARDDAYNKALAEGDAQLASSNYEPALISYRSALAMKPGETYPAEKITLIESRMKEIDNQYNRLIAEGDSRFAAREYSQALNAFQQASEVKPKEQYPKDKLSEINNALAQEKEQLESLYSGYIADGDRLFAAQSYPEARTAFGKASGLKPAEKYPKDKLNEIGNILAERARALKDEYDKAILTADNLYQQKVLDQAVDAYEKASAIKPDETYPGEMIRKIKQYINDHAIKEINKTAVTIASGDEKKFSFAVIEPRLRKNNYILVHARATSGNTPKVYLNYGRDAQKNGGIVLRTIAPGEGADYLIRLAGQDRWYREDNNWISIYTEGSDVEVSRIQISSGDE